MMLCILVQPDGTCEREKMQADLRFLFHIYHNSEVQGGLLLGHAMASLAMPWHKNPNRAITVCVMPCHNCLVSCHVKIYLIRFSDFQISERWPTEWVF